MDQYRSDIPTVLLWRSDFNVQIYVGLPKLTKFVTILDTFNLVLYSRDTCQMIYLVIKISSKIRVLTGVPEEYSTP